MKYAISVKSTEWLLIGSSIKSDSLERTSWRYHPHHYTYVAPGTTTDILLLILSILTTTLERKYYPHFFEMRKLSLREVKQNVKGQYLSLNQLYLL